MKDIVIIGAGDLGREIAWLIRDINIAQGSIWNILGFVDDNENLMGQSIDSYDILGTTEWLSGRSINAVCGIGKVETRKIVIEKLVNNKGLIYPKLIHPSVIIADDVNIGEGSIICAGNIISVNVQFGKHVYINLACTFGHDITIESYSIVAPGVNMSGHVNIGECSDIGTGSAIIQGVSITSKVIVGAGAVVIKDITEPGTYIGIPATRKK